MEGLFSRIAEHAALGIEITAVTIVVLEAFEALARSIGYLLDEQPPGWRRQVWTGFGMWLLLALQFVMAADIVRSTIASAWEDIGHLAAIAVIRTFLNYFLEKDIVETRSKNRAAKTPQNGNGATGNQP
jgi:uncharacterized membrane protein